MKTNSSSSSSRTPTVIAIVSILSVGVLAATLILRSGNSNSPESSGKTPQSQEHGHGEAAGHADQEHHGEKAAKSHRSEEHTSELQSQSNLVCRLLLEKKKKNKIKTRHKS